MNKPGNIGNSIVVTFGNYPLKTYFSPSFKVPFYQLGKMDTSDLTERFFDENSILYNVGNRNEIVFGGNTEAQSAQPAQAAQPTHPTQPTQTEQSGQGEAITFTPGPGVTAIVHGENGETAVVSGPPAAETEAEVTADPGEQILITLWRAFKEANPEGTLAEFYQNVASTNNEV